MVKRKALAFILIIVIALSAAGWLVYNQTVNQVENQTYDVRIADFKWTSNLGTWTCWVIVGSKFQYYTPKYGKQGC